MRREAVVDVEDGAVVVHAAALLAVRPVVVVAALDGVVDAGAATRYGVAARHLLPLA
jgi:hypothetical protein